MLRFNEIFFDFLSTILTIRTHTWYKYVPGILHLQERDVSYQGLDEAASAV